VDATSFFCRVTPSQKSRVIAALRRKGHVVGYIGDGINDAPPLHAANIGFSVNAAVDVAKEAACMILLRKDLSALAEAVREGRRTFANILKDDGHELEFGQHVLHGGRRLVSAVPTNAAHPNSFENLLYDLSETAIPMDRVDDAMIARPRHWDLAIVRHFIFVLGPLSSIF
jgi:P-type Mg2+ transporter